ncbi:hypothetical protein JGUZn3_13990 [Entomobacter blattae]|uniref:Uncharacterized protein n=1 Tax=Entomobacter blattae TaxID=2762277 RepID=A0A7H1NS64_9PROT|nr:hypothetical protein JGUZn3_13990 [Entomobacter blattae]
MASQGLIYHLEQPLKHLPHSNGQQKKEKGWEKIIHASQVDNWVFQADNPAYQKLPFIPFTPKEHVR